MDRRLLRIYVDNISSRAKKRDVEELFEEYGSLINIYLYRGCGYLEYSHPKEASEAIKKLDDYKFFGKRISVEYAQKNTNKFVREKKEEIEKDKALGRCFKCKEKGHLARDCD